MIREAQAGTGAGIMLDQWTNAALDLQDQRSRLRSALSQVRRYITVQVEETGETGMLRAALDAIEEALKSTN